MGFFFVQNIKHETFVCNFGIKKIPRIRLHGSAS